MNAVKKPLVEWKELQDRQPTQTEVREWICNFFDGIHGWARITGQRSGVIVLDFDGDAVRWVEEWGLRPHVRSGSGGLHLILKHPGWRVKTCNSKSSKKHGEIYPGLDVRGDGGYSIICGFSERGGYEWLRSPEPDELDVLPREVRKFFGLLEPPKEPEREFIERQVPRVGAPPEEGPTSAYLIERALAEATVSGRNNGGHWLIQQLHDNGYSRAEILDVGEEYVDRCPDTNTKGEIEEYTINDFRRTTDQVVSRPRREPWGGDDGASSIIFEGLIKEFEAGTRSNPDATVPNVDIDRYLVPTELGAQQQYPPWAIEDVVRQGNRVIFYAIAGAAKSYLAVDLSRAAVTGQTWLGRKVIQGSVIYIAAEDFLGIHHRVETAIQISGVPRSHKVRVFEHPIAVTNEKDMDFFRMAMDCLPEKPAFVIIDNLSLCMGDGDPNEGTDAKRFIDGCQALQDYKWRVNDSSPEVRASDERPITVVVIHHTNKMGNFNGSQYFMNLVDAMSELEWNDKRGTKRTLWSRKQRHGERHKPMTFELQEVDPVNKLCVVSYRDVPQAKTDVEYARRGLKPAEAAILDCLRIAMEEQGSTPVERGELEISKRARVAANASENVDRGLTRGEITLRSRVPATTAYRLTNGLKGGGLVELVTFEDEKGKTRKVYPERFQLTSQGLEVSSEQDIIIKAQRFMEEQKSVEESPEP